MSTPVQPRRASKKIRRQFEGDFLAILLAEEWGDHALPVTAHITDMRRRRGATTAWFLQIVAGAASQVLGDDNYAAIGFNRPARESYRTRVARRLAACSGAAWEAGIRRLHVGLFAWEEFSSHELIAAHERAAQWDRDTPDPRVGLEAGCDESHSEGGAGPGGYPR